MIKFTRLVIWKSEILDSESQIFSMVSDSWVHCIYKSSSYKQKLQNNMPISSKMQQILIYRKPVPHLYQWTVGWMGSNSGVQIQVIQDCG